MKAEAESEMQTQNDTKKSHAEKPELPSAAATAERERPNAVGIRTAALLMAASIFLSRILGWGREILLAYFAGAGPETDAYYAAFTLPDLLNYLVAGGALSIAFLPFYTRALTQKNDGEAAAEKLAAVVLGNLTCVVVLLTLILWWQAERVVGLIFHEFDAERLRLTVEITRIVLPAQIFFVIGGVLNAILFARGRFLAAALAPLLYNLSIIVFGVTFYAMAGIHGFAWGVLAGAFCGPFLCPALDVMRRVRLRIEVAPWNARFLSYLAVAAPLMFGQSLLTVDEWLARYFGGLLAVGSVALLSFARKLMLVPVAVVGQAIATAALPTMTRLWEEGRKEDLNKVVLHSLQAGLSLSILAAVAICLFANPLVTLFYQHGRFDAASAAEVAKLLALMAWGIPGWIVQQIIVRPFYARGDTWRPMVLGTLIVLAAIPLYGWLSKVYGLLGLTLAGVVGMSISAQIMLWVARRLHGTPEIRVLAPTAFRSLLLALAAAACTASVMALTLGGTAFVPGAKIDFGLAVQVATLGGVVYIVCAFGLGLRFGDAPTRDTLQNLVAKITHRLLRIRR